MAVIGGSVTKEQKVLIITIFIRHGKGIIAALEKWLELEKEDGEAKR